jgi:hypothetical protein
MKYYKLRIDLDEASVDAVVGYLRNISNGFAYVVEGRNTENPHIHVWFSTITKSGTMRVHWRKLSGGGNGGYSMKETDNRPIEYLAYMMKEGKIVWYNIPEDIIQESTVYQAKVKAEMKAKKEAKVPMWKKIYMLYLNSEEYRTVEREDFGLWSSVQRFVVKYHIENEILIRRFQCLAYVDTILCHMDFEMYIDQIYK